MVTINLIRNSKLTGTRVYHVEAEDITDLMNNTDGEIYDVVADGMEVDPSDLCFFYFDENDPRKWVPLDVNHQLDPEKLYACVPNIPTPITIHGNNFPLTFRTKGLQVPISGQELFAQFEGLPYVDIECAAIHHPQYMIEMETNIIFCYDQYRLTF